MSPKKKSPAPKMKPLASCKAIKVLVSQSLPLSQFGAPMPELLEDLEEVLVSLGAENMEIIPGNQIEDQSVGDDLGRVIVAEVDATAMKRIMVGKSNTVNVEKVQRVNYAMEMLPPEVTNPGLAVQSVGGFSTTIHVSGPDGALADTEVFAYGPVWPQRGRTDVNGNVTLSFMDDNPETISAIHIKPSSGHWSLHIEDPILAQDAVQSVEVKPLSTPVEGDFIGWGLRAIGVDQLPHDELGHGVTVAVIDSGIPEDHRDFHNVSEGIDVVGGTEQGWKWPGSHHGSHCAGVIAGALNETGMRSVAPGAELYISRIFPNPDTADLVRAIRDAADQEVDVISMSLGMANDSEEVAKAIRMARHNGIATIVAAGNTGGRVMFPGRMPEVLCVSAIGLWGTFPPDSSHAGQVSRDPQGGFQWVAQDGHFFARFSCFGPEIDLCGPGVAVNSAVPPDGFQPMDGTSMACPHIAGAAALVLAHNPDFTTGQFAQRNAARVDALFAKMKASCRLIPGLGGADRIGAGLIDVTEAIQPQVISNNPAQLVAMV